MRIEVNQCSDKAREVVEKLGGTVTTIYMDKLNLRKFLKQPLEVCLTIYFIGLVAILLRISRSCGPLMYDLILITYC